MPPPIKKKNQGLPDIVHGTKRVEIAYINFSKQLKQSVNLTETHGTFNVVMIKGFIAKQ